MFSTKDYSKMTLDELVSEEKRMKSRKILVALIVGFIVGIAVWSATHQWGAFFTFGLLILPLLIGSSYSKALKRIEAELSNRNTAG